MVTLSHRQPIIEKTSLKPDKPVKETHAIKEIEKIIPNPKKTISITPKTISITPKKKINNILKKKTRAKPEKKVKQKEVIEKESKPVKVVEAKPVKMIEKQNIQVQPAALKKTISQKKIQQEPHIEFAKPLYKKNPLPVYPVIAKKRGYMGTVELSVLVSEKGKINALKIFKSSGYKSLDQQAVKTVKKWLFEPGKKNGVPEGMWVKIPVKFEFN